VKTGNGQAFADAVGVAQPPSTVEESVTAIVKRVYISLEPGVAAMLFVFLLMTH
jgi:hypothetical protein